MASSVYNTIFVGNMGDKHIQVEAVADEADIKPGMIVNHDADKEFQKHPTADGVTFGPYIALENHTSEDDTTAAIDSLYDIGDIVYAAQGRRGEVYNMLIAASQGALEHGVAILVSNGDGTLKTVTADATTIATAIVGVIWQDLANVASVQRALVRIL